MKYKICIGEFVDCVESGCRKLECSLLVQISIS